MSLEGGSPSGASIRARLLNIAKREERDFNVVLNLYYQERLLARLAASDFRKRFLLKGGLLLSAVPASQERVFGRPTKDVDLRAAGVGNDPHRLRTIFAEICRLDLSDGIAFDPDGITTERITEDADYHGIRLRIPVRLSGALGRVQVDIGFGDIVTPGPQERVFPVLLERLAAPTLLTYPVETVVAEKFEAMIRLSLVNSRMKDFFDLHWLASTQPFEGSLLQRAISNTFGRRETPFLPDPAVFQSSFASDEGHQRQWSAFLQRSHLAGAPTRFEEVLLLLRRFLQPVHSACLEGETLAGKWSPVLLAWV